jgi:hypothetical protein
MKLRGGGRIGEWRREKLVEADDVGLTFYGLEDAGDLFGGGMRLAVGADADPVAGGAFEVDDVGAGIFAQQLLVKFPGLAFMMEDADLHAPSPRRSKRGRIAEHVDADARGAGSPDADFDGSGARQIQNAAGNEGSTVRYGDHDRQVGGEIGDADERAHGKGTMGGGHAVLVIDLAIGGMGVVIRRTVPAGNSNFTVKDGAGGFRRGLGWKWGGRNLFCWRRRRCGDLDRVMAAAGDSEAQDQQSGQSNAKGGQGIPELHNS